MVRAFPRGQPLVSNFADARPYFPIIPRRSFGMPVPERELILMRWGMSPPPRNGGSPVTNIRNTSPLHWRGWLRPECRCLVPFNSFAEYAPEKSQKDAVWFALNDDRR